MSKDTPPASPQLSIEPIIIERENALKTKVGGSLDPALAVKAEQAVQLLSRDFAAWLEEVITSMQAARTALGASAITKSNSSTLYTQALEVKSLGEIYGYPLITRFAHSLCRLLIRLNDTRTAPPALVDAHLDAIRAALRGGMKTPDHPVGSVLAQELELQVSKLS